jgi:hypothetical protein
MTPEPKHPERAIDSLDAVELVMAIEEVIGTDPDLTDRQREALIQEIEARIASGEFGGPGDFDDNALAAVVGNRGPRNPPGQAGVAAKPDQPHFD